MTDGARKTHKLTNNHSKTTKTNKRKAQAYTVMINTVTINKTCIQTAQSC